MSIVEMFVIYLRDDVLRNFIGDKEYRSWAPLVYSIFFFVLFGNVLGLIPIVGAPLPIMSYGGSSMMAIMIGLGIVMSCKIHKDQSLG